MPGLKEIDDQLDELFGVADSEASDDVVAAGADVEVGQQDANTQHVDAAANAQQAKPATEQQQQQPRPGRSGAADKAAQQRGTGDGKQPAAQAGQQIDRAAIVKQGGIVSHDGRLLARDAVEARLYNESVSNRRRNEQLTNEVQQLTFERDAYTRANAQMTQLGLSPVDATNAMQFMAHYRRDPIAALKNIIAEAQAAGHTIDGIGSQTDHLAMKQLVDQAVAPFVSDRQATVAQQQQEARLTAEINNLVAEKPWIEGQFSEIDAILASRPTLSLKEAAYELELYAARNGFDVNQPLRPQVIARQSQGAQPQVQQRQVQQRNNIAMQPPGMNATNNGNTGAATVLMNGTPRGGMERTRDILKAAFAENGIDTSNW